MLVFVCDKFVIL